MAGCWSGNNKMVLSEKFNQLGERECEIWADESYPPFVLVLFREESIPPIFRVADIAEGKEVFSSSNYEEVIHWLLEDEFSRVEGRTKILEWWEQEGFPTSPDVS
ncbi:MAG: hypothetical protein ACJ741_05580 [Pyrinomonadaceae bacterium]